VLGEKPNLVPLCLGLNTSAHGEKPMTDHLSYDMGLQSGGPTECLV
jgi:hypothetical protein